MLAGFAAGLRYDDIPERVREYCKSMLLDALGCALAGHRSEETGQIAMLAGGLAQSSESSVIGGDGLSLAGATILNSYLVTAVTMCDVHRSSLTHITPEVIPPALAIAERDDLCGRDFLVAIAAGCETTSRIGLGLDYKEFRRRGWHGAGVIGPFGAAAAVGRLLGFDTDTMARAFGLAGSQSAGTYAAFGTPTVKFHQCRAALAGLMAALLAQREFVATRGFLTAKDGGLFHTYTNGGRPEAVVADLGARWELEQIALRLWPSVSMIQGMVTAMFELVGKHDLKPARVRTVRVSMSQNAFELYRGFDQYKARFDALLSVHYTVAAILHDRRLSLAQFEPERYDDPVLRRFAVDRVEFRGDPALSGVQAVIEAESIDGSIVSTRCDYPLGSAENPLSRAQIEDKFRTYAEDRLSGARIEQVIRAVTRLEELKSVRELAGMLRAHNVTRGEGRPARQLPD